MKQMIYRLISMASLALLPLAVSAQALPFMAVDYNPATLGKGGASLVETSSVAYSALGNSATVPFSDHTADFAAGYAMWTPGAVSSNILNLAGAYNIKDKMGVSAAVTYGMNPSYSIYDDNGALKGQFRPSDMQVKAGFAYRFLPYLSAGVNVGYASCSLAEDASYSSVGADVYVMASFEGGLKAAAGVTDLGRSVVSASGAGFTIPTAGTLGVGYETDFAEVHEVSVQADAQYYFGGAFATAAGAEYRYNDLLSVRAGYRYGGESVLPSFASIGLGVHFAGFNINAACLFGNEVTGNTIAVSIGYSL